MKVPKNVHARNFFLVWPNLIIFLPSCCASSSLNVHARISLYDGTEDAPEECETAPRSAQPTDS